MLKQTEDEVESVAKVLETALQGIEQVTFAMDVYVRRTTHGKKSLNVAVTLYFAHSFPKTVKGGDDVEWLVRECRETAIAQIAKIVEISKANGLTK